MCFTVTGRKKTARKDIVVYKILFRGNISPWRDYEYNFKIQPRVDLIPIKRRIYEGYHFHKDRGIANEIVQTKTCIDLLARPFLIPKGTKYYENYHRIVAETCKMLTKKEAKQWN